MRSKIELGVLGAAGATLIASAGLAASAWRAVDIRPPAAAPPPLAAPTPGPDGPASPATRALPVEALSLIAENEPFRPERGPAPEPYRLPGDRRIEAFTPIEEPPAPPPEFVIVGTVATAEGGLAVIRTAEGVPPAFVRVGESVGGYRLAAVTPAGAVLRRGAQLVELGVADPAISRAQPSPQRGRNNRNDRERAEEQRARAQAEAAARQGGVGGLIQAGPDGTLVLPPGLEAAASRLIDQLPEEVRQRLPEAIRQRVQQGQAPSETQVIIRARPGTDTPR